MLQALYTFRSSYFLFKGFPDSSVGKESTCSAGDPSSIPGSGISTGEGIGYLFQCPWASLVAQLVKNLPAMWKTWVQSLGWEDPLYNVSEIDLMLGMHQRMKHKTLYPQEVYILVGRNG